VGGTDWDELTLLRYSGNVTVSSSDGDVGRVFCRPEVVAEFHDNGRVGDVGDVDDAEPGGEGSRDIEGKVMEGKGVVKRCYVNLLFKPIGAVGRL
jgi:hypothetical protein